MKQYTTIQLKMISGHIVFNDYIDFSKIPKLINAYQNRTKLPINFIPSQNYQSIKFIVNGIKRLARTESLVPVFLG